MSSDLPDRPAFPMTAEQLELLRRLTIGDDKVLRSVAASSSVGGDLLDATTNSLVRLAATTALSDEGPALAAAMDTSRACGADDAAIEVAIAVARSAIYDLGGRDRPRHVV